MRSVAAAVALALAVLTAGPAPAAADRAFTIGPQPRWFVLGGVTGGATVHATGSGFVGGELSVVRLRQGRFFGFYADGYYDFGLGGTYTTGGVELGKKLGVVGVGLDGGFALRFTDGDHQPGGTVRVFASVGVVALYARYAVLDSHTAAGADHVVQLGASLKFPLVSPW